MQPIKSISIPQPCHENWNKMTSVDQGRHCTKCSKTVTDFTAMTNTEIINYFARQGNVCGRFGETQLAGLNNYLTVEEKPRFLWKKVAIAAAVTSLFATADANAQRTLGKVRVSQSVNDTKKINGYLPSDTGTRTIRGIIKSVDDGLPLTGALVKVLNSNISTYTGVNGEYKLEVPGNKDTLEVTLIGFTPQKIFIDTIKGKVCNTTLSLNNNMALRSIVAGGIFVKRRPFYARIWYGITHLFSK